MPLRKWIPWGALLVVIQWVVFKTFNPYPSVYTDSLFYILDAGSGAPVGLWPEGYPVFLRLVHGMSHSGTCLVTCQFALLQLSTWAFMLSFIHLFQPSPTCAKVLLLCCTFNPGYVFLANMVSSDALFTALCLCWATAGLWAISRPRLGTFLCMALAVVAAFTVRYNALAYPLLSAALLCFSKTSWPAKATALAVISIPLLLFIGFTIRENGKAAGVPHFTGFTGWQLANNALYMYPFTAPHQPYAPNAEGQRLDSFVHAFFDSLPPDKNVVLTRDGPWFLQNQGPLNTYMWDMWARHPHKPRIWAYNVSSVAMYGFARHLIRQHPVAYLRYYLLPNVWVYLYPNLEQLQAYNQYSNTFHPVIQNWFALPSPYVYGAPDWIELLLICGYPLVFLGINLACAAGLLLLLVFRRQLLHTPLRRSFTLSLATLFLLNAGFSIVASPSLLRYQVFQFMIGIALLAALSETLFPLFARKGWLQ